MKKKFIVNYGGALTRVNEVVVRGVGVHWALRNCQGRGVAATGAKAEVASVNGYGCCGGSCAAAMGARAR